MMTNGDHEGRRFLSHPQTHDRFFFLLTIKCRFFILKNPEYAEMRHNLITDFGKAAHAFRATSVNIKVDDGLKRDNNVTCFPTCGSSFGSHGMVRVCDKNDLIWVKTADTPIWCARNGGPSGLLRTLLQSVLMT